MHGLTEVEPCRPVPLIEGLIVTAQDPTIDSTSFAAIGEAGPGNSAVIRNLEMGPEPSIVAQYWRIIKRRKWTVIGAIIAALIIGIIINLTTTRQYTAVATVEIARDDAKILNSKGVRNDVASNDQEFYQTQYGLLKSRALAERVVRNLKLDRDPEFRRAFGFEDKPKSALPFGAKASDAEVLGIRNILLSRVTITPVRLSRLAEVGFTSPNPALSAKIANAWSEGFIQSNIQRGFDETGFARQFLEERLASTRQKLEESERQAVDYASQQGIFTIESSNGKGEASSRRSLTEEDLLALNTEYNKAVADRLAAEAAFRNRSTGMSQANMQANMATSSLRQRRAEVAADYQRLLVQFEPGYPAARALSEQLRQLDRSIATEESRMKSLTGRDLQADYAAAVQRENSLRARVKGTTGSLLTEKRKTIQYNIYQREVDTNRALYDELLQRFKEIGVSSGINRTNVSVVDRADVPTAPSKPNILLNLLLSLFAGSLLGLLITIIQEQVDVAISDPTDVTRRLGLAVLGIVPQAADAGVEDDVLSAIADRKSSLTEAYISLRTTLSFTTSHGIPKTIAVTSTRPGEGKSTTAFALATLIASSGKRTLLIDCDMRSPSVHVLLKAKNDQGLSNALSGWDDLDKLLLGSQEKNLAIMPAGPMPPNAAELLASDRLKWTLAELGKSFDHIVLDSPPVIGLADALIVASQAEGTIYVIEAHATRVNQIQTALQRLSATDAHIIGAAVTKFQSDKSAFSYEYGYGYGYGEKEGKRALAKA